MVPRLVYARRAKMMLATVDKTDRLDARGMNRLQGWGTLPTVWIPPGQLRDKRELLRTRMVLSQQRTKLKYRFHATLAKLVDQLDSVEGQIRRFEQRMKEVFAPCRELGFLMSLPGVGFILAVVILSEVGDIKRFPNAAQFASYAGTTPRVHASGGKVRLGQLRSVVNRYLQWAFVEAANSVYLNRHRRLPRHITLLYERVSNRRSSCPSSCGGSVLGIEKG